MIPALFTFAALLVSAQGAVRSSDSSQYSSVVRTSDGWLTFVLRQGAGGRTWVVGKADHLAGGVMRHLGTYNCAVARFQPKIDALRIDPRVWVTACDVDGGGFYSLEYSRYPWNLATEERPVGVERRTFMVDTVTMSLEDKEVTKPHLFRPSLILHEGRDAIVASCKNSFVLGGKAFTWWATPAMEDLERRTLKGRFIGLGGDARIAEVDGKRCVVVRDLRAADTLQDPATLGVYTTTDMSQWQRIDGPATRYSKHACAESNGLLWVFGVVPGESGGRGELWNLELRSRNWQKHGLEVEISEEESNSIHLVPTARGVDVGWVAQDGRLVRRN